MRKGMADADGIILEDKGVALALHYRRANRNTAIAARKEFVRAVHGYQQRGVKIELLAGKEVIEAKPTGMTKDDAIKQILARYASTALPIYIGDERSDEAAFLTIADIGLAILVTETPRETAATLFLKDPSEVYLFLRRLTHMREKQKIA
jgi:trehalose 6-phosphate phosphatase